MSVLNTSLKVLIAANVALFAFVAGVPAPEHATRLDGGWIATALADEDGGGGKGRMGPSGEHGHKGAGGPQNDVGGRGQGQGGPGADSDAKGPRFMGGDVTQKPDAGSRGGAPAWAKDALVYPVDGTTAELGRMNVARAPDGVFERQLAEALKTVDPALYTLPLDEAIAKILAEDPAFTRIDSPLQNLAMLKCLYEDNMVGDGTLIPAATDKDGFVTLAALFIGSASDKTLAVTPATVYAVDKILGVELGQLPFGVTESELAAAAESVRVAIAAAHDN